MFRYEATGYPVTIRGLVDEVWQVAVRAQRMYSEYDHATASWAERVYTEPVARLEAELSKSRKRLREIERRDVTNDTLGSLSTLEIERQDVQRDVDRLATRWEARRWLIQGYVLRFHYSLKFSEAAVDVFTRLRERVDCLIASRAPEAVRQFEAVAQNLASNNPEHWSNAVHSCRRVLHDLADLLYPARADRQIQVQGQAKTIKLGHENYINRLVTYVEERAPSERFDKIVGSHLNYLGERLDAVIQATNKHTTQSPR